MNYQELVERVAGLPQIGESTRPYLLQRSDDGRPTAAFITLIPHADGTVTASRGDLRDKSEPVRTTNGSERVFADEDAACQWAWAEIRDAREPAPQYSAEQMQRAHESADAQRRRYEEMRRKAGRGDAPSVDG